MAEQKTSGVSIWLKGFLAAAIGGAATGATQAMAASGKVDKTTATVAGAGALITVLAYLQQPPQPPVSK